MGAVLAQSRVKTALGLGEPVGGRTRHPTGAHHCTHGVATLHAACMPSIGGVRDGTFVLCVWWALWSLGDYYLVPLSPYSELAVLALCVGTYLCGLACMRWYVAGRGGQRYARSVPGADAELGTVPVHSATHEAGAADVAAGGDADALIE